MKAIAHSEGAGWATDVVVNAGAAARLVLSVDRAEIDAHRPDWSFEMVTLAAVGNGDSAS